MRRHLAPLLMFLTLTGCGVAYVSPQVRPSDGALPVQVVTLDADTVSRINAANGYVPRSLPRAFYQTAGGQLELREGSMPPATAALPEERPAALETRLPPSVQRGAYQIGVGDVIILATRQGGSTVEELTGLLAAQNRRQGYTVQDDGAIAIPDVGRIRISGLTLEEAEAEVFQRLVENQIDPSFSLEIAEFNSQRVSVGGAVAQPSLVPLRLTPIFLDEVIAQVGGITSPDPDFTVVRLYRDGTLYQIPLRELFSSRALARVELTDGDSIFVDTAFELTNAESYFAEQIRLAEFEQNARTQALAELNAEIAIRRAALSEERSNFLSRNDLGAVEQDHVFLAGEVARQGRFPLPFEHSASLADAVFSGEGVPLETGNPSQIYLLRAARLSSDQTSEEGVLAIHLDAANPASLILATQLRLRPDDVIFVAEQPVTRWNRVVSQIVPSLLNTGINAASR